MYNSGVAGWLESDVYKWPDMVRAVELMATTGIGSAKFWLGEGSNFIYGLVNVAAFLAQTMQETIQFNACDENNWSNKDVVKGTPGHPGAGGSEYSSTSACGQLHQSYQDYTCSAEEDAIAGGQMACDVDPNMEARAATQATWYGAPPKLFCAPKSKVPNAPRWDFSAPWCAPPGGWGAVEPFADDAPLDEYWEYVNNGGSCKDYQGIKTGGWKFDGEGCADGACPGSDAPLFGQPARTDVEGCCWWGRGVIQTTGVCNFGKMNYYMGKRAADEGRHSIYPTIDFCKNPGAICDQDSPPELKWVAGFFFWMNAVQPYNQGGWNFIAELKKWVDGGMNLADTSFIDGASGIVNRGCHNPPNCGTGELHGGKERAQNFKKVMDAMKSSLDGVGGSAGQVPSTPSSPPSSVPATVPMPSSAGTTSAGEPCDGVSDSSIGKWFTDADFKAFFPNIDNAACTGKGFFNRCALLKAAASFPEFANSGDSNKDKLEFAAFLAHTSHETTGGWATAPGGPQAWGYCFKEERGCESGTCTGYCAAGNPCGQWGFDCTCAAGKTYQGRGPVQLSWNYNYGQFSKELFGDASVLINDPDRVANDATLAFQSAIWFWMKVQSPKPSCHQVMSGQWTPSAQDLSLGRVSGFGMTTNIINGGLECGFATNKKVEDRVKFFERYLGVLNVATPGDETLYCNLMRSYR